MRRAAGTGLFFLSALLASCSSAPAPSSLPRVVGGELAGAAPFMVGILDDGDTRAYCGGTLIAPRVVVTAAHCVDTPSRRVRVALGVSLNANLDRVTAIDVRAIRLHPGFDVKSLQNDIALLFLAPHDPATLPGPVEPLALNGDEAMPEGGQPAAVTAIGWGSISSYGSLFRPELRQVTLPVVPVDTCKTLFGFATVTGQQICAGELDGGGADACQGDSGGPLVQGDKLVGIVSWGHGCAQAGKPGVFTRVSSYSTWIAEETARFLEPAPPPDGQALADLVQAYCYSSLERHSRVAADDGSVLTIRDRLRMASGLEPAPSKLPVDGDEICALDDLPGVGPIHLRAASTHLHVEENGHRWQAPLASSSRVSLTCPSVPGVGSVELIMNVGRDAYVAVNGSYLDVGAKSSAPIEEGARIVECNVDGVALRYVDQPSGPLVEITHPSIGAQLERFALTPYAGDGALVMAMLSGSKTTGTMRITNASSEDVFSWKLSCDTALDLVDASGRRFVAATEPDGVNFSHLWIAGEEPLGTLRKGATLVLEYVARAPLPNGATPLCSVNGEKVAISTGS